METKKLINIKKGATIQTILLSVVIAAGIFIVLYNYIVTESNSAGIAVDPSYTEVASSLQESQTRIDSFTTSLRNAGKEITEADLFTAGYYGLKGAVQVITLPLNTIDIVKSSSDAAQTITQGKVSPTLITTFNIALMIILIVAAVTVILNRGREL